MDITLAQVRTELSKDPHSYIDAKITRHMASAKASLLPAIGFREGLALPAEFEELSNTYIVEYCRALIDGVDNEKAQVGRLAQLEALIREATA